MHLHHYLELLRVAEQELATSLRAVADAHAGEPDVLTTARMLAGWSDGHVERLQPFSDRYADTAPSPPDALHTANFHGPREGPLGLLRDLHDLYVIASSCDITWVLIGQAAKAARDEELMVVVEACDTETSRTMAFLKTRMKAAAPQALVVA